MICCPNCGARNFKAEEQLAALSSSPSPDSTSNASRQEVGHAKTGGEIPPTTSPSPGAPGEEYRRGFWAGHRASVAWLDDGPEFGLAAHALNQAILPGATAPSPSTEPEP